MSEEEEPADTHTHSVLYVPIKTMYRSHTEDIIFFQDFSFYSNSLVWLIAKIFFETTIVNYEKKNA